MNQHRTVARALSSIKESGTIPERFIPFLRPYMMQVYAAGWEECRDDFCMNKNKKKILQRNKEGKIVNTFKSITDAHKVTNHTMYRISKSVSSGLYIRGYKWEVIPVGQGVVTDL